MPQPRTKASSKRATTASSDTPTRDPGAATPGAEDNTEEIEIEEESMQMRDKFSVNVTIDDEVATEVVYYYVEAARGGGGKLDVGEFLPPCRRLPNLQCKTPFYITYLIREVPVNSRAPGAVGTTEATPGAEHQNVLRPSVVCAPWHTPAPRAVFLAIAGRVHRSSERSQAGLRPGQEEEVG